MKWIMIKRTLMPAMARMATLARTTAPPSEDSYQVLAQVARTRISQTNVIRRT